MSEQVRRRRRYTAAPDDNRCEQDIVLKDKSHARCMKRKAPNSRFCVQHAAIQSAKGQT